MRAQAALDRAAGALLGRPGGGRGPDRGLRAGAAGACRQVASPAAQVSERGAAGASSTGSGAIVNESSSAARRRPARATSSISKRAEQHREQPSSSRAAPGSGPGRCAARRRTASPRACRRGAGADRSPSQRSGSNAGGSAKVLARSGVAAHRAPQTIVPTGTADRRRCVSRSACSTRTARPASAASSRARRPRCSRGAPSRSGVRADGSPATRVDLVARRARPRGGDAAGQISQASVLAVVSSPASSIVSTLPATSLVADAGAGLVGGGDHRFEQIGAAARGAPGRRAGAARACGDEARRSPR